MKVNIIFVTYVPHIIDTDYLHRRRSHKCLSAHNTLETLINNLRERNKNKTMINISSSENAGTSFRSYIKSILLQKYISYMKEAMRVVKQDVIIIFK